jgi:regulator of replication initiation timing
MLLLNGGNMRDRRKEKELREQLVRIEEQRNYWMNQYSWISEEMTSIIRTNKGLGVDIQKLKKELEEQKQIAAKHISMYYDVVQNLKTVMEETNYGQNL